MPSRHKAHICYVEAEGFRDGTQKVDRAIAQSEISAAFAGLQETVRLQAAARIKALEARVATPARRLAEAETRWARLGDTVYNLPPAIVLLLCAALAAGPRWSVRPPCSHVGNEDAMISELRQFNKEERNYSGSPTSRSGPP